MMKKVMKRFNGLKIQKNSEKYLILLQIYTFKMIHIYMIKIENIFIYI